MTGTVRGAAVDMATQTLPPMDGSLPVPTKTIPFLPGRIVVAGGDEHPCRMRIDNLDRAVVVTAARGPPGTNARCQLENVGALPARITTLTPDGFHLTLLLTAERRARIAARLAWHSGASGCGAERRQDARIVPAHRDVCVRVPDGPTHDSVIIDLSMTGAKIGLPGAETLIVGATVIVGKRYAQIIRVETAVIAVCFRLPFTEETFNLDTKL